MLEGKVALVTGGGRGIGRAVALRFCERGADLVIAARTAAEVEAVAQECRARGRRPARAVTMDVGRPADWDRVVESILAEEGKLDILVNNAGAATRANVWETTPESFRQQLTVNLTGAFLGMRACAPAMIDLGWGRIINVASVAALQGTPTLGAYAASKAALLMLTEAMARELREAGHLDVTCNAVLPGAVATGLYAGLFGAGSEQDKMDPDRVADLCLFLASDDSAGVSQAKIEVRHY